MKILTTNLNKGGVRKTTFSHNFAEWLALNGNRCLVLDTDDSRNLTLRYLEEPIAYENTIISLYERHEVTPITVKKNIDLIAGSKEVAYLKQRLITVRKRELIFFKWIEKNYESLASRYDYIVIDTENDEGILTENSLIVSDVVVGITDTSMDGYVFEEIAKAFHCRHEHFWDGYHLNRLISDIMKNFPSVLEEKLFSAIEKYSKKSARTVLDTAESYIDEDDFDFEEKFKKFKNKLLNNFSYTKLPEQRGIKPGGIGVLESNHTKLCYRMKKQARRWTKEGALTMGKMIIDKAEGKLEELFYGSWREEDEEYNNMDGISAQKFLAKGNPDRGIRHVRQANKSGKRRY